MIIIIIIIIIIILNIIIVFIISVFTDWQRLRVQENADEIPAGNCHIWVFDILAT